jgi:hypothetical protein
MAIEEKNAIKMDLDKPGLRFYTNNDNSYVEDHDGKVYGLKQDGRVVPLPCRFFGDRESDSYVTKEDALAEASV